MSEIGDPYQTKEPLPPRFAVDQKRNRMHIDHSPLSIMKTPLATKKHVSDSDVDEARSLMNGVEGTTDQSTGVPL